MAQTPLPRSGDRIAKLLARAGVASRREVERMIAEGRVALDGKVLDTPATVLGSLRGVTVDGQPVALPEPTRLFLYHKPTGLLVAERDPKGRTTIYDRLPSDLPRLVPVGRLDLNTEGLLLLTTDGGFKRQLELPSTGVERSYRARAYGNVTQQQLEALAEGVEVEGIRYGSIDANIERRTGANVWIEITITEGKNREVRRILEYLGLQVSRLIRTRYGPFVLGDLPIGEVGEVKQHEVVAFRRTLKGGAPDEPVVEAPRDGFRTAPTVDRTTRARTRVEQMPRPVTPARGPDTFKPRREPERTGEVARAGFRKAATTDRAARSRTRNEPTPNTRDAQERPSRARAANEGEGRRAPRRSDAGASGVAARPARPGARPNRDGTPMRDERPAPSGGQNGRRDGPSPDRNAPRGGSIGASGPRAAKPGARPPRRDGPGGGTPRSTPGGGTPRPTSPGGRPPRGRRP